MRIFGLSAALGVIISLGGADPVVANSPPPNVLFIAVDDLRPELRCYGAEGMHTPNIDRLASQGLLFERAYCQVAVCNPSRSSLLSGCRPDTTRILANNTFLPQTLPHVVTLPLHFKNHGYHTVSLGKIFHHSADQPGDVPHSWSEPSWYHGTPYRHWFTKDSTDYVAGLKKLSPNKRPKQMRGPPFEAAVEPDDSYPDGMTAAKAMETLGRLKDRPFFLGVGFVKPHLPFTCPQKYWDLYPADKFGPPADANPPRDAPAAALHDGYELRTYGRIPAKGGIDHATAVGLNRGYRACVSFLDAQVGRLLDELDRLGLSENTLVVFWGDHGYHLGENGIYTKMTNFELGTRVPLIVRTPKQSTAGRRSTALVELVDLYPTLAELCGLPQPAHLEGTSFAPLLNEPGRPWKQAVFSEYLRPGKPPHHGRSVRTARWRYTEWVDPKGIDVGRELYDETNDPHETTNLADHSTHAAKVAELAKILHAGWREATPR